MENNVRTALALQGGGALGAYEYGVIKELYESRGQDFKPAVITGISIGAVNAAILAGAHNPIETLDQVWRKGFTVLEPLPQPPEAVFGQLMPPPVQQYFSTLDTTLGALSYLLQPVYGQLIPPEVQKYLSTLGNESMYRLRSEYFYAPLIAPFFTTSFYDTSPLRETLKEIVDLEKLNRESRVVVTAINIETGKLAKFGNTVSINEGGAFDNQAELLIDHILASGSIPPGFPIIEINGSPYWDGGLYSNTPLSEAINCLERCDEGNRDVKRELIVVELVPMAGQKPANIPEVMSRFFNIIFASKLELDEKLFSKYAKFIDLAEDIDLLLNVIKEDDELRKKIDEALKSRNSKVSIEHISRHDGYKKLLEHKKIDAFTNITFTAGQELRNAADFSKASIEARIEAGRQEARKQKIGAYHWVTNP